MSGTSGKFILAYAVLVILPLLALVGILKSGRGLRAPASIDGTWRLNLDSSKLDSLPCGKELAAMPDKEMLISQSGKNFLLTFPGTHRIGASGTLDGTTLQASLASPENSLDTGCGGRQLALLATIERHDDSSVL